MIFEQPNLGDTRVKAGFAWLPVSAQNGTVWLCWYWVQQIYVYHGYAHWLNVHVQEQ